jgi:hypothetical protein
MKKLQVGKAIFTLTSRIRIRVLEEIESCLNRRAACGGDA